MEKTYQTTLNKIKETLKGLIKADSTTQEIETITALDKDLDELSKTHEETQQEAMAVKDKLVELVKTTSFKSSDVENNSIGEQETHSLDDVLADELNKIGKR